jgi:hypothetical protein
MKMSTNELDEYTRKLPKVTRTVCQECFESNGHGKNCSQTAERFCMLCDQMETDCKSNNCGRNIKRRVVVSIREGAVIAAYGDENAIELLIVDHDGIEQRLYEDHEFCGAEGAALIPLDMIEDDTLNAVNHFDEKSAVCAQCENEFNPETEDVGYMFCSKTCEKRHWRS